MIRRLPFRKEKWMLCFVIGCFFLQLNLLTTSTKAQDVLMAKANKTITLSYGASNYEKLMLTSYLSGEEKNNSASDFFKYTIKYSNPVSLTFDYALSDYTTLGIGLSYYSFHLTEDDISTADTIHIDTKGSKIAFQIRGIRYIVQRPRSIFYLFAGAGVRSRSVTYNTNNTHDLNTAYIHQINETKPQDYSPLSVEAGMGLKFLVTKTIGISSEFGAINSIARFGLFYSLKNKWRRTNDNIGW